MTSHTTSELIQKRNELAGQIIQTENLARQLRSDIASIEAAIRIMHPGMDMPKIVPRRIQYRARYFAKGQLTRLILDFLREHADAPVAVADIMPAATGDRVLNRLEHQRLSVSIFQVLNKLMNRGIVERSTVDSNRSRSGHREARWQIVQQ
jgi:hypothetical protein